MDFENITQRELESYFKAYKELGGDDSNQVLNAGASVRAAVKVGWSKTDVDNAKPKDIMSEYVEILKGVNAALLPPSKN
jgi:hypothetical protein